MSQISHCVTCRTSPNCDPVLQVTACVKENASFLIGFQYLPVLLDPNLTLLKLPYVGK